MGFMPTPEQITQREVPTMRKYQGASVFLKDRLEELVGDGSVYGALIYGSTRQDDIRIGSDIDVFIVLNSREGEEEIRKLKEDIKSRYFVPLEINPLIVKIMTNGKYSISSEETEYPTDGIFREYLETCLEQENIIGKNPINVLGKPGKLNKEERATEIEHRNFEYITDLEWMVNEKPYSYDYCQALEKILRWPIFDALGLLWVKNGKLPLNEKGKLVSKERICSLYGSEFGGLDPLQRLDKVMGSLTRYKNFISKYVRDCIEVKNRNDIEGLKKLNNFLKEYKDILDEIRSNFITAINFMEGNRGYLFALVEGRDEEICKELKKRFKERLSFNHG